MTIERDDWLAAVLERPVFRVTQANGDVSALSRHTAALPGAFYYAKVAAENVAGLERLSSAGFRVVEGSLTFGRDLEPTLRTAPTSDVHVEDAGAQSAAAVLDIAECAFRYSRFHLDCAFERRLANRVKREWIRSYLEGRRGERLLVAFDADQPAGFLAFMVARRGDAEVGIIDLVGVHPQRQRRGIGAALVRGALDACAGRCGVLEVGTQTANIPSIRLYERLGFRVARSGFTLHLHVPLNADRTG